MCGVPIVNRATAAMKQLLITAFDTSTRLKPNWRMMGAAVAFMAMAPTALAKVSIPDWSGFMPKPSCRKSGSRKGVAPTPMRKRKPPTTLAKNVSTLSRLRSSSGAGAVRAWRT